MNEIQPIRGQDSLHKLYKNFLFKKKKKKKKKKYVNLVVGPCIMIRRMRIGTSLELQSICDPSQQNKAVVCYQEKCDIPCI